MAVPQVHTSEGAVLMMNGPLHVDDGATGMKNGQARADEGVAEKGHGFRHQPTNGNALLKCPLERTYLLDKFKSFDVTPSIGTEFPDVQLTDLLCAHDSDALGIWPLPVSFPSQVSSP